MPILSQLMPKARALQPRVCPSTQWQLTLIMQSVHHPCHLLAGIFRALGKSRSGFTTVWHLPQHPPVGENPAQFHLSVILDVKKKIFESVQNETKSFFTKMSVLVAVHLPDACYLNPCCALQTVRKYDEDKWLDQKIFSRKSKSTQTHKKQTKKRLQLDFTRDID